MCDDTEIYNFLLKIAHTQAPSKNDVRLMKKGMSQVFQEAHTKFP